MIVVCEYVIHFVESQFDPVHLIRVSSVNGAQQLLVVDFAISQHVYFKVVVYVAMVSEVPLRYGIVAIIANLLMTFTNVGIQTNSKKKREE